jgi:hypothetical protein
MWLIEIVSTGMIQGHRTAPIYHKHRADKTSGRTNMEQPCIIQCIMAVLNGYRLSEATATPKQQEQEHGKHLRQNNNGRWKCEMKSCEICQKWNNDQACHVFYLHKQKPEISDIGVRY